MLMIGSSTGRVVRRLFGRFWDLRGYSIADSDLAGGEEGGVDRGPRVSDESCEAMVEEICSSGSEERCGGRVAEGLEDRCRGLK